MSDNTPNTNNPIGSIFDRTFGFDKPLKGVSQTLNAFSNPALRDKNAPLYFLNKFDKARVSNIYGGMSKFGANETRTLIHAIKENGLMHAELEGAIHGLAASVTGGKFLYDGKRGLYFGSERLGFSALPLQGMKHDVVTFGQTNRTVNLLGILGSNNRLQNFTFAEAYYGALNSLIGRGQANDGNFRDIIEKKVLKSRLSEFGSKRQVVKGQLNIDRPVIFFDLETGGLELGDDILQLHATKFIPGQSQPVTFSQYFKNTKPIPAAATKLNHITEAMLERESPFAALAKDVNDFFGDAIVAGYNARTFDTVRLNEALRRAGINSNIGEHGLIDVYDLYKKYGPGGGGKKLTDAFSYYTGRHVLGAHNASVDVQATIDVLNYMIGTHPDLPTSAGHIANMMRQGGVALSHKSPTLSNLLMGSGRFRGIENRAAGIMPGLVQRVSLEPGSKLAMQIANMKDARRILTTLTKFSGNNIRTEGIGLLAGRGMGGYVQAAEARSIALAAMDAFGKEMPGIYEELGIGGLWPLSKAEHLIAKDGQLILPTRLAGDIFGDNFNEAFYGKGLHQLFRRSMTTEAQAKFMLRAGWTPAKNYLTRGAFEGGMVTQHLGIPMRMAVVEFASDMASRQIFGEGGAIFTHAGLQALQSVQSSHTVYLGANEPKIAALQKLIPDINLASGDLKNLNRDLTWTTKDVHAATRATKESVGGLSEKQKLLHVLLKGEKEYHNVFKLATKSQSRLNAISLRDGMMALEFVTGEAGIPNSLELEVEGRRLTGVRALKGNKFAELLQGHLKGSKVMAHASMGADEFAKLRGPQAYLEHFFASLSRHSMLHDAAKAMGLKFDTIKLKGGGGNYVVPIIDNEVKAFNAAQAYTKSLSWSGDVNKLKLADEIEHGQLVLSHNLASYGVKGVRVFTVGGSIRSDFMMDINVMKSARITPSKLRNLALGSRMHGFENPMDDVVYRAFARGLHGRGLSIDPKSMDLLLGDKHMARKFAESLTGKNISPNEDLVIRHSADGLKIGNKSLKALPDLAELGYTKALPGTPGLPIANLKGTIFDKEFAKSGVLWLDMGEKAEARVTSKGVRIGRYIPLPVGYLRSSMTGPNGRVLIGKTHPAYVYGQIQKLLEGSPEMLLDSKHAKYHSEEARQLRNHFFDLVDQATTNTLVKLSGKHGLFEKKSTLLVPSSFRTRLIPNRSGNTYAQWDDVDKLFTIEVGEHELKDVLHRRYAKDGMLAKKGGWKSKNLNNFMESVNKHGYGYAVIGADPMQRPEHASLVKIKMVKDLKGNAKYGQLNVQADPRLLRMLERDVDRDAVFLYLTQNLVGADQFAHFEERFRKQADAASFSSWIYHHEMRGGEGMIMPWVKKLGAAADSFNNYMGQKALAHLGYSFARPIDYFRYDLEKGAEGIQKLGLESVPRDIIDKWMAPFMADSRRGAVAEAAVQHLYQAGVAKSKTKSGLIDITGQITDLAQKYKQIHKQTGVFDVEAIRGEAAPLFYNFLKGQDRSRAFLSAKYLLEQEGHRGQSLKLMLQDLMRGSDEMLAEKVLTKTSMLLADAYGVGHAFAATFRPKLNKNVFQVIHRSAKGMKDSPYKIAEVISALSGTDVSSDLGHAAYSDLQGEIKIAASEAEKAKAISTSVGDLAEKIGKGAAKFFDSPSSMKWFGAGAAVGALGYAAYQNVVTPDVSQPQDYGPQQNISQMQRATIYGPGMRLSAKVGNPSNLGSYQNFNSPQAQNIDISLVDRRAPFDPRLAQNQMKRLASADFAY